MQQQSPPEALDLAAMVADLNSLLRLKTTVIGHHAGQIELFRRRLLLHGVTPKAAVRRCAPV